MQQQSGYQMMGTNQQQATVQRTNQMAQNSRQMQVIQPQQAQQPGRIINTVSLNWLEYFFYYNLKLKQINL